MDISLNKLQEMVKDREAWRATVLRVTESDMTDWLNNIMKENVKKNIYIYIYVSLVTQLYTWN